ncbi:type IV pilus biogenesis protein EbsA [Myxosarcina sp. GI1]|uniref:type IV pilus biogenesis protein EbsA n=1 Tax=Myxosarcina sp. GI1 TaxID=1541065 RepID=UPI00055FAA3D|nr:type IV pilus biogenesis protein EbsA [Myxosarcina sp. GI1]
MPTLEQLKPASRAETILYIPYYAKNKHSLLPQAIALYQQGSLEGDRNIEGGESIPFVASWYVSKLPSELTRCRLQFDGQAELSYEVTLSNSEFIDYLIDVIVDFQSSKCTDFPRGFYRKLLRFE